MLGVTPPDTGEHYGPAHAVRPAAAIPLGSLIIPQLGSLILTSCILSLLIGGGSLGRPFTGSAEDWQHVLFVLVTAALLALMPMVITFLGSVFFSWITENLSVRRSYRDGLAAAWFFVLASNISIWMTLTSSAR